MVQFTINGRIIQAPAESTVLRAADAAGIPIPTLCDHPDLTPYGGCRLCLVEVKGARLPATACTLPVQEGMVIETETPALTQARRTILELLLSNYHDAGYTDPALETQFTHWIKQYGLDIRTGMLPKPHAVIDSDPNPFVWVDLNKCILCTRCVRACAEVQGRFVWSLAERGMKTHVVAGADTDMLDARCESCGACVAYCPTGALDNKMSIGCRPPTEK